MTDILLALPRTNLRFYLHIPTRSVENLYILFQSKITLIITQDRTQVEIGILGKPTRIY